MQPTTADDRPNILADIKRDHAHFFSLHRRFQEELDLSDHAKQVIIWQVCVSGVWLALLSTKLSTAVVCTLAGPAWRQSQQ